MRSQLERLERRVDTVPPGWLTVAQWAEKWGMRYADAWKVLIFHMSERRMVRRKYRVHRDPKSSKYLVRLLWHFKPCRVIQADTREVP